MVRVCWIACVVVFAAFVIACGAMTEKGKKIAEEAEAEAAAKKKADEKPRAEATKERVISDGLRVDVLRYALNETVELVDDLGQKSQSTEPVFVIELRLLSGDAKRRFDYTTWRDNKKVTLRDDLGNTYRLVKWSGLGTRPVGGVNSATVHSDKWVDDVIVFERPVPAAKTFDLDLPPLKDGGEPIKFRLSRTK